MSHQKSFLCVAAWLFFAAPAADAQTLTTVDSLAVYDSKGQRLGTVLGGETGAAVLAFQLGDVVFRIQATREGFTGPSVVFQSVDCSGEPLFLFSGQVIAPATEIGDTTYVGDIDAAPQSVSTASLLEPDGSCGPYYTANSDVIPAVGYSKLLSDFTPPFTVRPETLPGAAGSLSFPTAVRGGGASSQLVVGAGANALSLESSFHAPDGTLIESRSVAVQPHGVSTIDFVGTDLEFGALALTVEPSAAHVLSTEIIELADTAALGVPASLLCSNPEYLIVQRGNRRTAGAFANPSHTDTVTCDWQVLSSEGVPVADGTFEIPPAGQEQFFPDERGSLPADFLGSFRASCDGNVHVFSLFQSPDGTLTSNAAGCGER